MQQQRCPNCGTAIATAAALCARCEEFAQKAEEDQRYLAEAKGLQQQALELKQRIDASVSRLSVIRSQGTDEGEEESPHPGCGNDPVAAAEPSPAPRANETGSALLGVHTGCR